jgi:hypothetical protein
MPTLQMVAATAHLLITHGGNSHSLGRKLASNLARKDRKIFLANLSLGRSKRDIGSCGGGYSSCSQIPSSTAEIGRSRRRGHTAASVLVKSSRVAEKRATRSRVCKKSPRALMAKTILHHEGEDKERMREARGKILPPAKRQPFLRTPLARAR